MRDSCGFAASVSDYVKRSCGFARIRPVPGRLWGVFNTPLHGDMKWLCGMAAFAIGDMKWSYLSASPSFSGDKKRGGPVAGAPLIIMQ